MRNPRFLGMTAILAVSLAAGAAWADEPAATTPPKADASHTAPNPSAAKQSIPAQKAEARKAAANARKDRPDCLKDTGSRIPPRPGECLSEPGHSWSQDDLERTGKPTAAGGLHSLDPLLH